MIKYPGAALMVGVLWAVALMIPEATRAVMLADHPVAHFFFMAVVSVLIAMAFRRPIASSRTGWRFVAVSVLLPFVGAALWYVLVSLFAWLIDGSPVSLWEVLIASILLLPTVVGAVAIAAYYVVIPMGLLSQYVMNRLARGADTTGRARHPDL